MTDPVSTIRNLGPAAIVQYGRAGINSADDLRNLGPDDAYGRMLSAGGQAHFVGYYALVMGLQGRPWNDCSAAEKVDLRKRFDRIKSASKTLNKADSAIDRALDAIGVVKR